MSTVTLLLMIAAQLSILTYNIGALIYALPIPSRRLKRWAPILIEDGLYAALLMLLFTVMMYISDYIASYSGVTLTSVAKWLEEILHTFFITYLFTKAGIAAVAIIPGARTLASALAFPITLITSGVIVATVSLLIPIYILMQARAEIAALGIALYALPFRIGRNIGASLIAFAVVGNIVFSFTPHWLIFILNTVSGAQSAPPMNQTSYSFWGLVKGVKGSSPVYALVVFNSTATGTTYRYPVLEDGAYYVAAPYPALPSGNYMLEIEYMGLKLTPTPSSVNIPSSLTATYEYTDMPYRLDLTVPNTVFFQPQSMLITNCQIEKFNTTMIDRSTLSLQLSCIGQPYAATMMVLAGPALCRISDVDATDLASPVTIKVQRKPWRGVPTEQEQVVFVTYSPTFNVELKYTCSRPIYSISPMKPQVIGYGGVKHVSLEDIDPLAAIIVYGFAYSAASVAFLTIASSLILGFARFLGARSPRLVIIDW